jgi:hypothetical protein
MRAPYLLAATLLLTGCSAPKAAPAPAAFNTTLATKEVMAHVVAPAATAFWRSSGFVATRAGVQDLLPTTDAGWLVAENGAATVAEAGNLLMLPGRGPDDPEWRKYAAQMSALGLAALAAADARSEDRMMEVGARLDEACDACHLKYMP